VRRVVDASRVVKDSLISSMLLQCVRDAGAMLFSDCLLHDRERDAARSSRATSAARAKYTHR